MFLVLKKTPKVDKLEQAKGFWVEFHLFLTRVLKTLCWGSGLLPRIVSISLEIAPDSFGTTWWNVAEQIWNLNSIWKQTSRAWSFICEAESACSSLPCYPLWDTRIDFPYFCQYFVFGKGCKLSLCLLTWSACIFSYNWSTDDAPRRIQWTLSFFRHHAERKWLHSIGLLGTIHVRSQQIWPGYRLRARFLKKKVEHLCSLDLSPNRDVEYE